MLVSGLAGMLFRRYWGGWLNWPQPSIVKHFFKINLALILSTLWALLVTHWQVFPSMLMGAIMAVGWMAPVPPGHAYGTWMMNGQDNQGRRHYVWLDCLALAWCYLLITVPVGLIWFYLAHDVAGLWYMPRGALVPLAYYVAKVLWQDADLKTQDPNTFPFAADYTSIGELWLGTLIYF